MGPSLLNCVYVYFLCVWVPVYAFVSGIFVLCLCMFPFVHAWVYECLIHTNTHFLPHMNFMTNFSTVYQVLDFHTHQKS